MTVGIVLVSHSLPLADAAASLAAELAGGSVSVLPAGGTQDGLLGTSIDKIDDAVSAADSGDGVVVLMDVGSAVLTAKTLLAERADSAGEQGGPDMRLADAPLVEGAIAAAVTASTGQDVDAVLAAAEEARTMRKL